MKLGLAALCALVVAGCGNGLLSGGGTPAGFKRIESKDAKFSLAVPEAWVSLDTTKPEFQQAVKDLDAKYPGRGMALQSAASMGAQAGLAALDVSDASINSGFATNVNVVVTPGAPKGDADIEAGIKELETSIPGSDAKIESGFPGGKAIHLTASMNLGLSNYDIEQYTMFVKGTTYSVTLSVPKGKGPENRELAVKIAKSIKVN